jgi:hypothetical protein
MLTSGLADDATDVLSLRPMKAHPPPNATVAHKQTIATLAFERATEVDTTGILRVKAY